MSLIKKIFSICLFLFALNAAAFEYEQKLRDEHLEETAQEVFHEIRCLVCAGESLAESEADFSRDLRREVRERLMVGESKDEVLAFLTKSYGQQILQTPPIAPATYLLWLTPLLLLILGVIVMRNGRNKSNQESD
ncbi:MAG: cytochrome C biogenesis protein CcmH [Alphaproteobacteria bacterium CG11_big_fil_rev_8_21_14_0_20_44_7]|nr:MAG: cytochrome C biogenesis protein CcmH [Alphaproteobacteria bacterium CG11_big_fil_rev_8_21_14_0_20_44_7]